MPRPTFAKPNWSLIAALLFCAAFWTLAADGTYRATHDNGHGIRRAVQAKAVRAAHRLQRWMA